MTQMQEKNKICRQRTRASSPKIDKVREQTSARARKFRSKKRIEREEAIKRHVATLSAIEGVAAVMRDIEDVAMARKVAAELFAAVKADREKIRSRTDTMPPFETSFCSVCGSKSRKDPRHGDWCSKVKQKNARLK
jgi:hypothetical protein